MLNYQRGTNTSGGDELQVQVHDQDQDQDDVHIRDIHALIPPQPSPINRPRWRETWETSNHISSSLSMASEGVLSENFTSVSREFSALVLAGSSVGNNGYDDDNGTNNSGNNLAMVGEEAEMTEEMNPLAIVPDNNPQPLPRHASTSSGSMVDGNHNDASVHRVKKEEVEAKIIAWKTAKISKINNRFKREEAIINGRESEQVHKSTSWMKKVERKLEEKRARALEKMQNEVAKAHRKAEEKRATAEAKRGTKVARILQVANLMKTVGRPPVKRSFF